MKVGANPLDEASHVKGVRVFLTEYIQVFRPEVLFNRNLHDSRRACCEILPVIVFLRGHFYGYSSGAYTWIN
jgi:hypothetical protein